MSLSQGSNKNVEELKRWEKEDLLLPKEIWYKKLFHFQCKICGKDRKTLRVEIARNGVCGKCKIKPNENQSTLFDLLEKN